MGNALGFFHCLANRWLARDYAWGEPSVAAHGDLPPQNSAD
jgi:hypothetical protein